MVVSLTIFIHWEHKAPHPLPEGEGRVIYAASSFPSIFQRPAFGLFLVALAILVSGCAGTKSFRPMTPSQIISGELSRDGNAALEKGDYERAEKKLEEAVKLNKKDAELRRHYAEALWTRGKHREALEQLNEAAKRCNGTDVSLEISLAEKSLFMGDPITAFQHADQATRFNSKEYKGWALRGKAGWCIAERQLGQVSPEESAEALKKARNDYYRALSLSPNNREVLPDLAMLQMRRNEPESALATWQNLQELYPPGNEPADVLQGKAEAYHAMGRMKDAVNALAAARQRVPNDPNIARRLQEFEAMSRSTQPRR